MLSVFTGTDGLLPGVRVETRELIQDVNLHRGDLTKLICSMNKLLCSEEKTLSNANRSSVNRSINTLKSNRKLRGNPHQEPCIK